MDDGDWGSPWADAANHRSRVDSDSRNQGQDIGSAARSTGISDADDASENLNASRNGDDAFGVSKTSPTAGDALWEGFEDSLAWADAGNAAVTGVAIETIPDWTAGGKDNGGLNSASVEMDTRKDGLDDEASGVWNRGRENSLVADGFSRWATGSDWDKTNTIHDNDGEENEYTSPSLPASSGKETSSDTTVDAGITDGDQERRDSDRSHSSCQHVQSPAGGRSISSPNEKATSQSSTPAESTALDNNQSLQHLPIQVEDVKSGGSSEKKSPDREDIDDDFGDFAEEGGEFDDFVVMEAEPVRAGLTESSIPCHSAAVPLFDIDKHLVFKLYPVPTSYHELPPISKEVIHTTGARKTWYRLQAGTLRKTNSADDDTYVRVTWSGSRIQGEVHNIVSKWAADDKISGGGKLHGMRNLRTAFQWKEASSDGDGKNLSHSRIARPPTNIHRLRVISNPPPDTPTVASPQAASFGWGSLNNQMASNPITGAPKEKPIPEALPTSVANSPPETSTVASPQAAGFGWGTRSEQGVMKPTADSAKDGLAVLHPLHTTPSQVSDPTSLTTSPLTNVSQKLVTTSHSVGNPSIFDGAAAAERPRPRSTEWIVSPLLSSSPSDSPAGHSRTNTLPNTPWRIPAVPSPSAMGHGYTTSLEDHASFDDSSSPSEMHPTVAGTIQDNTGAWDLSIFEQPPPATSQHIAEKRTNDLWDTPISSASQKADSEENKMVKKIIDELPDLSYMLV